MNDKNAVLFVSTFSFVTLMMLFSFTSILLGLKIELRLSGTQFGLLLSVFSIAYAAMQIPSGILSDKFGGKVVLSVGLTLMGLATLGFSFSSSTQMAISLRMLSGLGGGLVLPAAVKLLSGRFIGGKLTKAMSIFGVGQGVGFVLTYAMGSGLSDVFNWRMVSLLYATIILAIAVLSLKVPEEAKTPIYQQDDMQTKFERRTLALLIIINFAALSVTSGVLQFAPSFLEDRFELSTSSAGWIISLMGIISASSPYLSGIASRRIRNDSVIIISMLICTLFPLVLGFSFSITALLLVFGAIGLGTMFYFPSTFSQVPRTAKGQHAGRVFGIFNTISFGASAGAPLLFGHLLDTYKSYEVAFAGLSILAFLGLIASIVLKRSRIF